MFKGLLDTEALEKKQTAASELFQGVFVVWSLAATMCHKHKLKKNTCDMGVF